MLGVKGDETRDEHDDEDAEEGDAGAEVDARVLGVWEETRGSGGVGGSDERADDAAGEDGADALGWEALGTMESAAKRKVWPAADGRPNIADAMHSVAKEREAHATAATTEATTPTALVMR